MNRFWSKVDKSGDCWIWTAGKFASGYGQFQLHGKPVRAHRLAWELCNGPIPNGLCVCHTCDNPACVCPDHLWLGTNEDNTADMIKKGRWDNGGGIGPRPGEENPNAKLTDEDVRRIREAHLFGASQKDLAQIYPINSRSISNIVNRKTWSHVT